MADNLKPKKKKVTFTCTESIRKEPCLSDKKKLPNIYFCPREKLSYLSSVSRQFKGRTLRQKRRDELVTKLPNLPKRVRYAAKSRNSLTHHGCKPVLISSSIKKYNGCFPKEAENQIYFDNNGRIVVKKIKKKQATEKNFDLLNLPSIPPNLEFTKPFDKTPMVNKHSRKVKVSLLKLGDLDKLFNHLIKPQNSTLDSVNLFNQVRRSPVPDYLTFSPTRIVPLATTDYLNQLWIDKCMEFKNYVSLTSQNHESSFPVLPKINPKENFGWHTKSPNDMHNRLTSFLGLPPVRRNYMIKPSDSISYCSDD